MTERDVLTEKLLGTKIPVFQIVSHTEEQNITIFGQEDDRSAIVRINLLGNIVIFIDDAAAFVDMCLLFEDTTTFLSLMSFLHWGGLSISSKAGIEFIASLPSLTWHLISTRVKMLQSHWMSLTVRDQKLFSHRSVAYVAPPYVYNHGGADICWVF